MRFLGDFFIGPLRPEGTWQVLKSPDSRFVRKYGALFEDNRGPPMVLRGATYETDPVTGWVNRGQLQSHLGRPLISFRYPLTRRSPPSRPISPQALVSVKSTFWTLCRMCLVASASAAQDALLMQIHPAEALYPHVPRVPCQIKMPCLKA